LTLFERKCFKRKPRSPFFDHKTNKEISEEMKAERVDEKQRRYKSNCQRHVTRMKHVGMATIMLNSRPNGRRRLGRPLYRILDEAETGKSSTFISIINQLDAQNFCFTIYVYFMTIHVSSTMCSSSGGQNCITQPLVSSHLYALGGGGIPGTHFRHSLSRPQGHSTAERIM